MDALTLILLLASSAFFSSAETAFIAANRPLTLSRVQDWPFLGPLVEPFLQHPRLFLTTTLVGNTIALVGVGVWAVWIGIPAFTIRLSEATGLTQGWALTISLVAIAITATPVLLLLGDYFPRLVAKHQAERAVFLLAAPLHVTYILFVPIIKLAGWISRLFVRLHKADGDLLDHFLNQRFERLTAQSTPAYSDALDAEERAFVGNVLRLSSIRVKESMVPRTEIEAIDETATLEAFREQCIDSGHSKLPVYRDNIDHIVGIAFAYDFFYGPQTLADVIRPVQFMPESKLSKDILTEFLGSNTSIAIVIDEYGGTAGLITLEDVLEELFGDIQDEFDSEATEIRRIAEHTLVSSGRVELDELNEHLPTPLPDGDYETLAGYILSAHGTIPKPRDEFTLDGHRFVIMQSTSNRIDLVKIFSKPPPSGF